jgi:hypothetical protein
MGSNNRNTKPSELPLDDHAAGISLTGITITEISSSIIRSNQKGAQYYSEMLPHMTLHPRIALYSCLSTEVISCSRPVPLSKPHTPELPPPDMHIPCNHALLMRTSKSNNLPLDCSVVSREFILLCVTRSVVTIPVS